MEDVTLSDCYETNISSGRGGLSKFLKKLKLFVIS